MFVYLVGTSTLTSFIKLIALLIVFVLVLGATYAFTRWYAKSGLSGGQCKNIEVKEAVSLGTGKQICIVRVGETYLAVSSCKDRIEVLAELREDELEFHSLNTKEVAFKDMLAAIRNKKKNI